MFGFPGRVAPFTPDRWLEGGDTVTFGNVVLEVIHTPGHTPGHVVFFHRPSKLALVGDVLFAGSIGRTDFPGGNHDDADPVDPGWACGRWATMSSSSPATVRCPPSARNG